MLRRQLLKTALAVGLTGTIAGCSEESGPDGSGSQTQTGEGSAPDIENYVQITDHGFSGAVLLVTVENVSGEELDLVQVEADLYDDDTRIAHSYTNISSLPPETTQESEIRFLDVDGSVCDTTRYDLVPQVTDDVDEYEHRYSYDDISLCENRD